MKSVMRIISALALTPLVFAGGGAFSPAFAEDVTLRDGTGRQKVVTIPDGKNPWLTGICSFFVPGLGQFINGSWGMGAVHLGLNVLLGVAQANAPSSTAAGYGAMRLGLNAWSTFDAAGTSNHMTDQHHQISRYLQNFDGPLAALPDRIPSTDSLKYIRTVQGGSQGTVTPAAGPLPAAQSPVFINNVVAPGPQPVQAQPASPAIPQVLNISDPDVYFDESMGLWRKRSNARMFWDANAKTWVTK